VTTLLTYYTTVSLGMADKAGAYGSKAADTDFRKKRNREEYAEKARKVDQEEKERMQENEERMKQGQSYPRQCWQSNLC